MLKKQQKKKSKEALNSKKAKDQSEIEVVPVFRWSIANEGKSSQQKGKEKVYNFKQAGNWGNKEIQFVRK